MPDEPFTTMPKSGILIATEAVIHLFIDRSGMPDDCPTLIHIEGVAGEIEVGFHPIKTKATQVTLDYTNARQLIVTCAGESRYPIPLAFGSKTIKNPRIARVTQKRGEGFEGDNDCQVWYTDHGVHDYGSDITSTGMSTSSSSGPGRRPRRTAPPGARIPPSRANGDTATSTSTGKGTESCSTM